VHKRTYSRITRVKQTAVKRWATAAEPEKLAQQLNKMFPGGAIHSAYEAGFSGFGLHRVLCSWGIEGIVVRLLRLRLWPTVG